MKFIIDENIPPKVTAYLEGLGHDVKSVLGERLTGISDENLMKNALDESRALVTFDKHFGDILRYPPEKTAGVILLKIHPPIIGRITNAFDNFFKKHGKAPLKGRLIVLSDREYRIRGGSPLAILNEK